jgi:hypothetical protein
MGLEVVGPEIIRSGVAPTAPPSRKAICSKCVLAGGGLGVGFHRTAADAGQCQRRKGRRASRPRPRDASAMLKDRRPNGNKTGQDK